MVHVYYMIANMNNKNRHRKYFWYALNKKIKHFYQRFMFKPLSLKNPDIQRIQNLCKTNENKKIPTWYSKQKNLKVCMYTKTKKKKMIHDLLIYK